MVGLCSSIKSMRCGIKSSVLRKMGSLAAPQKFQQPGQIQMQRIRTRKSSAYTLMTGPMRKMQNESVKSFDALASRPRFHTKQTTTHLLGNTQIVGARVSQNTTSKPNSAFDRTSRVLSAGHSCNIIVVQRSFWTGPHRHLSRPIFAVEQFPYTDGALFVVAPDTLRQLIETQDPVQANIRMMILPISAHLIASLSRGQN
jgi:hypothetical protein